MAKRAHILLTGTALGISSLLGALSGSAMAQAAPEPAPQTISDADIVVTAQRRSESINRVPLAVQALSADALDKLQITDVESLATSVPGLQVSPAYSGVPIFTLRGIGFNTTNITATSTVGIYQDELAYPYPSMAGGPIFDLERVEVLKGPQGTLYGRNTTAGLIDFITAKPKQEFSAGGTVELGNYETYNFEGHLNVPLGDHAAFRVAFRNENSDKGWQIDQTRGDRLSKVDRWGGRASLYFAPSSSFEGLITVSGWRDRSDTQAGQAISLNLTNRLSAAAPAIGPGDFNSPALLAYLQNNQPTRASQAGFQDADARAATVGLAPGMGAPRAHSDFISTQMRLTWSPNDQLSIISLTGYNDFKRRDVVDFGGAPLEIISTEYDARIKSFSQELRFEGNGPGFNWTVGGYFAHDKLRENSRFLIGENSSVVYLRLAAQGIIANPVTNAIFNSAGYIPGEVAVAFREGAGEASGFNETWSAFANGELDLGGGFKVNAGVRGGIDHGELDGCSTDYNGNYLPIVNTAGRAIIYQTYGVLAPMVVKNGCTTYDPATNTDHRVHSSLDQGNFSGRFALNYQPSDTTLLYASIARGVKSGVIPIVPANRAVQFTPAKQEKLTAYEAGIKTAIGGRLAQLNVSGFYYDYTDKQFSSYVPDPTFGALQRLVNIPSSHAWGIDGEVTLRPDPALTLVWNAVYLKTKVEDYVGANAAGIPTDFSGSEFSYAPEFSTSGTAMLNLPITSGLNFQATGNVTYQTSTHSDFGEDPLFRLKGYALVNGSIGVASRDGRWSLNLWARNLTNEYYWTSVVDNQNLNVRFAGRPRTFGMSLTAGF
jgi:iron complex outermembrane recepter protein